MSSSSADIAHVLVTGASSGIGEAVAYEYAQRGARLALFARRREELERVAVECRRRGAIEAIVLAGDTTQRAHVGAAAQQLRQAWPRVDRAFLNAGGGNGDPNAPARGQHLLECCRIEGVTVEDFDADVANGLMQLNYGGVVNWLEPLLAWMREARGGVLVATGALSADRALPRSTPYCATKAALRSLFEGLRPEAKRYGIHLCLIEPGFVDTQQSAKLLAPLFLRSPDQAAARFVRGVEAREAVIRYPWQLSVISHAGRFVPRFVYDRWVTWTLDRHDRAIGSAS